MIKYEIVQSHLHIQYICVYIYIFAQLYLKINLLRKYFRELLLVCIKPRG